MTSKPFRAFLLPCLLLCIIFCSCARTLPKAPLSTNSLPTPPHSELTNQEICLSEDPVSVETTTIDEIIQSMKRLHALPNKSAYRPHLEELSTKLFQKLLASNDPEIVMMTMLAAASCHHPLSHNMAFSLVRSSYPIIQLAAIQALCSLNTTEADCMLVEALRSDYPVIRLEAAWYIAHKRIPQAFFHIDTLKVKLPAELLPYLPELYAAEGSSSSIQRLRQLLLDPDEQVVLETILAIGKYNLTSFSDVLTKFTSHSPAVLEALAFALQNVPTDAARDKLKILACHSSPYVSLRACLSLIAQGDLSYQNQVQTLAKEGNIFALSALGSCPQPLLPCFAGTEKCVNLNLALSQLMLRDAAAIPSIKTFLALPETELLCASYSPGHALSYWDVTPSQTVVKELEPTFTEQSLRAKEYFLSLALELDEAQFLDVASYIFQEGIFDLYPCLLELLENKQSKSAIALLHEESMRVGAPYNRAFATLGLVKIKNELKEKDLVPILSLSREKKAQSWRFPIPWIESAVSDERMPLQQTSMLAHLYISTVGALAENGSPEAISILVEELSLAPQKYLPFVVSALLYATL